MLTIPVPEFSEVPARAVPIYIATGRTSPISTVTYYRTGSVQAPTGPGLNEHFKRFFGVYRHEGISLD